MNGTIKPAYQHDGEYAYGGYYPRDAYQWENLPPREEWVNQLPALMVSPEISDRVLARIILTEIKATLPETWLVVEAEDSPNLQNPRRIGSWTPTSNVWSAHESFEDATAWCESYQTLSDAHVDAHPWWGEQARRKFVVILAAGALVSYLRQPGADPARHNSAFK